MRGWLSFCVGTGGGLGVGAVAARMGGLRGEVGGLVGMVSAVLFTCRDGGGRLGHGAFVSVAVMVVLNSVMMMLLLIDRYL